MNFLKYTFLLLFVAVQIDLYGQEKILFEVEGEPIHLEEFQYIYDKTNRDQADYSEASVQEYLDLYTKFKLKVHKARQMKLDTIKSLQTELAGYRKQLANTYLSDKEVLESLAKEAFDRMQQDVDFSHILFKVNSTTSTEMEETIYQRALSIVEKLRSGEDFVKLALEVSEDATVKKNDGRIGYVTAMLPDGFYELETALYALPLNSYSRPVQSKLGYHIVKVNKRRDARGEIDVSQILIRSGKGKNAKEVIDTIHAKLVAGADFSETAKSYSEDKATAPNGGHLGFFGINQYESIFENTAFRIKEDGAFSRPIRTSLGWHIIQRNSLKPKLSYEEMRRKLEADVKKDGRFTIAENAMLDKIKEDNGFEQSDWDKEELLEALGDDFLTYKWKAPATYVNQDLARIGSSKLTISEFLDYLTSNTAARLRINRSLSHAQALDNLFEEFLKESILRFEEGQLEEKFPEFKALMREYSEGILLFEATKMKVWDRASEDTTGLKAFYRSNQNNYMWPERAREESITIYDKDISVVNKVVAQLAKKPIQKVLKKFNKKRELVQVQTRTINKEELDPELKWSKYALSIPNYPEDKKVTFLKRIGAMIPPERKSIDEARGYIIADYQDHLEKQWVQDLEKEFEVVVHKDVLTGIIKG